MFCHKSAPCISRSVNSRPAPGNIDAVSTDRQFLGVPAEGLQAIGCLIVAAGRLEGTIRRLAGDLLIYAGKQQPSALIKAVSEAGLPEQARTVFGGDQGLGLGR